MGKKHNAKHEKICWLKTVAGKISIILLVVAVLLSLIGWSFSCRDQSQNANLLSSLFIGLATNLIGIIVTVSFVQYFLDNQKTKEEEAEEALAILRYSKIMQAYINRYIEYFNCVVTPISKRNQGEWDTKTFATGFKFCDLQDLYEPSLFERDSCNESSISLFFKAENELIEFAKRMVENIDFKYNEELYKILASLIYFSINSSMRDALLNNMPVYVGNNPNRHLVDDISQYIRDDKKYNWVEEMSKPGRYANIMGPYVNLYHLLNTEKDLIEAYSKYIAKLEAAE